MKRIGNLYEQIIDYENISKAIDNASLGKRDQRIVREVFERRDKKILNIQSMLRNQTFVPAKGLEKKIRDGNNKKERIIFKPNFYPDQIIHWALVQVIQPIFMRSMYEYSVGSIPGRGLSKGSKAVRNWLDHDIKNTKYCLKMDVQKFYPSIDNEVLKQKFRRKIKDKKCLWLIDAIIDGNVGQPIGFYTSQWFSNFFLEDLDHYIKETLGVKYYVRYVDDLVCFGPNKRKLHKVREAIDARLAEDKLTMKGNWQVFYVSRYKPREMKFEGKIPKTYRGRPVDFLGLKFYRDKTTLRARNSLRWSRRIRRIGKKGYMTRKAASAFLTYKGFIKGTDSYHFYQDKMLDIVKPRTAKITISRNAKAQNRGDREEVFDLKVRRFRKVGKKNVKRN
jgi:hypothetical protein